MSCLVLEPSNCNLVDPWFGYLLILEDPPLISDPFKCFYDIWNPMVVEKLKMICDNWAKKSIDSGPFEIWLTHLTQLKGSLLILKPLEAILGTLNSRFRETLKPDMGQLGPDTYYYFVLDLAH